MITIHPQLACPKRRRRRGLSLVVVMGLLAITLAVTYALLRTEVNSMQLLGHVDRRDEARQAAYVGLSAALRKMHQSDWGGVTSTVSGTLSSRESYTATYATGDSRIVAGSADDAKWPYRVTIVSIGKAVDPTNSSIQSTHTAKAIVELVPRAVAPLPSSWATRIQPFVVTQWGNRNVSIDLPSRIRGAAHLQGTLKLAEDYPNNNTARDRYLTHLNLARAFGQADNRPFNGPVSITDRTSNDTDSDLNNMLSVSTPDISKNTAAPLSHPGTVATYRLYPGGVLYSATTLPATLQNTTLQGSPRTNPLGIFVREGWVQIGNNVTIKGTVIASGTSGTIELTGTNINLTPVDLPALAVSSGARQMPTLIVSDDLLIQDTAQANITGLTLVSDYFRAVKGGNAVSVTFRGRVVANGLELLGRTSWDGPPIDWQGAVQTYDWLGFFGAGGFFTTYMQTHYGLDPTPKVTIRDDTSNDAHFWPDWSDAIFQKHSEDPGLRWDVLDWGDA